jgi:hypothetical protein
MWLQLSSYLQNVFDWAEKHAGLGGWVGALAAFARSF